jgi:hypothetical protein
VKQQGDPLWDVLPHVRLLTDTILPCVAMTHIEAVVPSWSPELPQRLRAGFKDVQWYDAGGSECYAVWGCDLLREIKPAEEMALQEALQAGEILLTSRLTR